MLRLAYERRRLTYVRVIGLLLIELEICGEGVLPNLFLLVVEQTNSREFHDSFYS